MGREPGIGPAQLTCPNTDTDHSDQSVPVLFAPLFLEGQVLMAELKSRSVRPLKPRPAGQSGPLQQARYCIRLLSRVQ